jgi:diazepam-binding inhibitor (GABA receptor modulating acyl-CoA-binding protein)
MPLMHTNAIESKIKSIKVYFLYMSDAKSTGNPEFIKAAEEVRQLSTQPSNEVLIELYGLFKQSIEGDCNTGKKEYFE